MIWPILKPTHARHSAQQRTHKLRLRPIAPHGLPRGATRFRSSTPAFSSSPQPGTWISLDVSKDGRTIAFGLLGDLYTLPSAGGAATRITRGPGYDTQPRYSPDGRQLVFLSDRNGSENVRIANADGSAPRALTRAERLNFVSPIWTPDGQYVVVTRAGQLWLYHKNGGAAGQRALEPNAR